MQYFASPYELLFVAFLLLAIFALLFYVLVSRLCQLEEDLGRLRRHEASRRSREQRWSNRSRSLAVVRDDGTEELLKPLRRATRNST